jgi:hypothetical protein
MQTRADNLISVERHWRVAPAARATVSASTYSTAEATKLETT